MPEFQAQIRRAVTADAPPLARLSAALFPLGCPPNTKQEDLAEYVNRELTPERFCTLLEDDRNVILIAQVAEKLAGYALIAQGAPPPHTQLAGPELRKFYIDAAYHGRGMANALMQKVLATATDRREGTLWLSVFSGNKRAISFYRKWGFRIAGTQDFLVGSDRQLDYLMQHETKGSHTLSAVSISTSSP